MKIPKLNIIFRLLDILLCPFMWVLGGFNLPIQETHPWHVHNYNWGKNAGLVIDQVDKKAKFGHESPLGLFHMPIFGGLTRYVVIEASGYNKLWHVGWKGFIHNLDIKQKRIMMLVGKKGFIAYGLSDNDKKLNLKIVDYGELGDNRFNNLRLF